MTVRVIQGDVRDILPTLAADSFDCIVTSPPYFGLRDYGTGTWKGGDPNCKHLDQSYGKGRGNGIWFDGGKPRELDEGRPLRGQCHCGASRVDAQIGLEPTLDAYLETMVAVCRELRRVLKPSGVCFINIGDSYANTGGSSQPHRDGCGGIGLKGTRGEQPYAAAAGGFNRVSSIGGKIKPKDLCLVPERLGIALQADGLWVRSRIVWSKPNPMPERCTDRPTSAHETVWMLTKSAKYFWDGEAIRQKPTGRTDIISSFGHNPDRQDGNRNGTYKLDGAIGANCRNVWEISTQPFPGAHFATFPPALVERCIKAGSSEKGCCAACGKPLERVVERKEYGSYGGDSSNYLTQGMSQYMSNKMRGNDYYKNYESPKTTGWQPSCKCAGAETIRTRILDPFAGSGTVGLVADRLGRDATLIDLNTSYIDMAVNRIRDDSPLFSEVAAE